jgi:hypothetical protein
MSRHITIPLSLETIRSRAASSRRLSRPAALFIPSACSTQSRFARSMVRAIARASPQWRHEGQREQGNHEIQVAKNFYPENIAIG